MTDEARTSLELALPAYEIAGKLGQGAFGVVYEARHAQLGRQVAIKQLPQSYAEDDAVRERFVAEAQMVASLDHPHIVPVYDFVESEGSRFLIMERCAGSVGERFKSEGIVTDEACAAVLACLAALDFAHEKGLLHRDVKPENLMYDTKGVVKLGDFGIARDLGADTRRTATGMIVGTPAYMSPEQCRGDDLTPASDVYSVAVMGYELLTGALPFPDSGSVNGLLAHHLVTEPTPLLSTRPELPGAVGEVIDRALSKDLTVRYSSAAEFATALARGCVTAFGSGWLRRRRFVLHWPEIIAETERPGDNSPRTGTIMVRAGDATHAFITPDEADVEPTAQMQHPHESPPNPIEPQAVAVVADEPAVAPVAASTPVTASPDQAAAPTAAPQAPPANPATPVAAAASPAAEKSGPNLALIGGVIAAILAAIAAFVFLGGGSDTTVTATADVDRTEETQPTQAPEPTAEPALQDDREQEQPTAAPEAEPTLAPEPTAPAEPTAEPTVIGAAPTESNANQEPGEQPFVIGSNGGPILNNMPPEFDQTFASGPWDPSPCDVEAPRSACIYAIVNDPEENLFEVYYFSNGFTPQLDPVGYHLHFYIPELVDGDETKAGAETPGGSFRQWSGPWPATSAGGDNGRTFYSLSDFVDADSHTLCVIVADPENRAIPGTGNCSPVIRLDDDALFDNMVDRLEGQWVGGCPDRASLVAPTEWRWFSLNDITVPELARTIRPTDAAAAEEILQAFADAGGVIWAEGPVEGDFIVNFSVSIVPGDFTINDEPGQVAATLGQLGVDVQNARARDVYGRNLLFEQADIGNGVSASTYIVPDFGYAISMTFTAPGGLGYAELADRVAQTISGC